jgi:hypothetical protein
MTPAEMGRKGGSKTGASKRRGDSEYYRALAAKRQPRCPHCFEPLKPVALAADVWGCNSGQHPAETWHLPRKGGEAIT